MCGLLIGGIIAAIAGGKTTWSHWLGSLRRRLQLAEHGPQWQMVICVVTQTRLQKIADGEADATILAAAGLKRLGLMGQTRAVLYTLCMNWFLRQLGGPGHDCRVAIAKPKSLQS